MAAPTPAPAPRPVRRPSTPRAQGQWALGYREPLNPNERTKRDNDGLLVKQRILDIYAHRGFDSIDGADLRGRFRWFGLYTQRAQGIPGGKTAVLEPEELEDRYFMLRVRIDGGRLTSEQLRVVAGISTEFGRDVADVTDRQNVQYHWIRI
ncbi:MAG TPA: nitrite/sulfite reductase, partial [Kribbellaceae bacterium]